MLSLTSNGLHDGSPDWARAKENFMEGVNEFQIFNPGKLEENRDKYLETNYFLAKKQENNL